MKKIHCIAFGKYRKIKNSKISNMFEKELAFFINCSKCNNEGRRRRIKYDIKISWLN